MEWWLPQAGGKGKMLRCLMGRVLVLLDESVLRMDGSDGCTVNVLNATETVQANVKRVKFMFCVFCHTLKERKKSF